MKNKIIIFTALIILSCSKNENKNINETQIQTKDKVLSKKINKKEKYNLINSKWIIGNEGLNGVKPDTIHFLNNHNMRYVSSDTGSELINYTFKNDTLSYSDKTIEFDINLDKEITITNYNKLALINNKFYQFYYKTKINNKDTVLDLSATNYFRRIK